MENSLKIRRKYSGPLEAAIVYFEIVSVLNNMGLTPRHLTFLAYIATNKETATKEEYIKLFKSSETKTNTLLWEMRKAGIVLKDKKLRVHPSLTRLDFKQPITLTINMELDETS